MSRFDFDNIFKYKESLTYKLKVKNRLAVNTNEESGIVLAPEDLECFVNGLYKQFSDYDLRIFIRPAGTEDVLRVHMEAKEKSQITEIKSILDEYILGHSLIN